MNIQEIKQHKREVETQIAKVLSQFQKDTDVFVDAVNWEPFYTIGGRDGIRL